VEEDGAECYATEKEKITYSKGLPDKKVAL